jgi:hypothetical protein
LKSMLLALRWRRLEQKSLHQRQLFAQVLEL